MNANSGHLKAPRRGSGLWQAAVMILGHLVFLVFAGIGGVWFGGKVVAPWIATQFDLGNRQFYYPRNVNEAREDLRKCIEVHGSAKVLYSDEEGWQLICPVR